MPRLFIASVLFPTLYLYVLDALSSDAHRERIETALPFLIVIASVTVGLTSTRSRSVGPTEWKISDDLTHVVVVGLFMAGVAYRPAAQYGYMWHGFGLGVAGVTLAIAVSYLVVWRYSVRIVERLPMISRLAPFLLLFVLLLIYFPSFIQPGWAIINAGDATHQVLEELSGPLVGHFPGVNSVSTYTTLLGLPLVVLRFIPLSAEIRMASVLVWANILTILVPTILILIARQLLRPRHFALSVLWVVPVIAVSGRWGAAASNMESLSMIPGRTLMPVLLGWMIVRGAQRWEHRHLVAVGITAVLTAFNNVEFGAPASVAAIAVVVAAGLLDGQLRQKLQGVSLGLLVGGGAVLLYSLVVRGSYDVWFRIGSYAGKPYSPAEVFPIWSTHNLLIAVFALSIIVGLRGVTASPAGGLALFSGLWGLLAFPYCSYRCVAGMYMSTQVYLVPAVMCAISIVAVLRQAVSDQRCSRRQCFAVKAPVVLLASLAIAAVLQAPNPLDEWKRVAGRADSDGWASDALRPPPDQWSTSRIDWLDPQSIADARAEIGSGSVGYFGYMGNSVQLATGINNLTRINSAEVLQIKGTNKLKELACREVDDSRPAYIVLVGMELPCRGYHPTDQFQTVDGIQILMRDDG